MSAWTLDSILEALNKGHQRATYGAVASLVGTTPQNVMERRERDPWHSWVVNQETGLPTKYDTSQMHQLITQNPGVLRTGDALEKWLQHPTSSP